MISSENPDLVSNPSIQTYSGEMFNIFDPDPSQILVEDIAHSLSMICRYGGHARRFYSVAEHCVLLALHFESQNRHDLARAALLHDATEAYMGDLVRPIKLKMDLYREVEDNLQRMIFMRFGLPPEMPGEVKDADLRICNDERSVLMVPRTWTIDDLPLLEVILKCWPPVSGEQMWLQTFWMLFG